MIYALILFLILIMICKICDCYGSYIFFKKATKGPYFDIHRFDDDLDK